VFIIGLTEFVTCLASSIFIASLTSGLVSLFCLINSILNLSVVVLEVIAIFPDSSFTALDTTCDHPSLVAILSPRSRPDTLSLLSSSLYLLSVLSYTRYNSPSSLVNFTNSSVSLANLNPLFSLGASVLVAVSTTFLVSFSTTSAKGSDNCKL